MVAKQNEAMFRQRLNLHNLLIWLQEHWVRIAPKYPAVSSTKGEMEPLAIEISFTPPTSDEYLIDFEAFGMFPVE